eukprot:15357771-Ditylum_brightwellii.AAC.1
MAIYEYHKVTQGGITVGYDRMKAIKKTMPEKSTTPAVPISLTSSWQLMKLSARAPWYGNGYGWTDIRSNPMYC